MISSIATPAFESTLHGDGALFREALLYFVSLTKCLFTACMTDAQPDHLSFILHVQFGSVIAIHVSFQQRNVPCTLQSTSLGTATRYWTHNSCVCKVCAC